MITKLPVGFKALILKRLRDPEMKKAHGYLSVGPTEMCCLGHIIAAVGKGFQRKPDEGCYRTLAGHQAHMPRSVDLPDTVYKSLQSYLFPSGKDGPIQAMAFLASHNDGDGAEEWSLLQAADWIEENL